MPVRGAPVRVGYAARLVRARRRPRYYKRLSIPDMARAAAASGAPVERLSSKALSWQWADNTLTVAVRCFNITS